MLSMEGETSICVTLLKYDQINEKVYESKHLMLEFHIIFSPSTSFDFPLERKVAPWSFFS